MGEVCATEHLWRLGGNFVGLLISNFMRPLEMDLSSPGLHRKSLSLLSHHLTYALFTTALFYTHLIVLANNRHSINIC